MRRILSLTLALLLVMACLPIVQLDVHAETISYGMCGDNTYWKFDSNGVLTIYGTGATDDWAYSGFELLLEPWLEYEDDILSVIIEEGVTRVGDYAFSCCHNLKSVSMPDSLTSLGSGVFYHCRSMESFEIPVTITELEGAIFGECTSLSQVILPEGMTSIPSAMFEKCISLTSIRIPETVTTIGAGAFESCYALTSIELPNSVIEVGTSAFAYCNKLASVSLSDNLEKLGNTVFENCLSLTSVTVPASVITMAHTFQDAYGLQTIKFLGNSPVCASNVFGNITVTVYYPSNNKTWMTDFLQDYGGTVTWVGYESAIIPNQTVAYGVCGENLTWTLTDEYMLIISGTGPMYDYRINAPWDLWKGKIKGIIIEDGVTSIGESAFGLCMNVESAIIADTVSHIGSSAFHNCGELNEVTIPESVTAIETGAFSGCISLQSISFLGDVPKLGDIFSSEVTTIAYYPSKNITWNSDVMRNYGGHITWLADGHVHQYTSIITEPNCTERGYTTHSCLCGNHYVDTYVNALGHTWSDLSAAIKNCTVCGIMEGGYRITLNESELHGATSVWIDGAEYALSGEGSSRFVDLEHPNATNLVTYTYNNPGADDIHAQYPTGMRVWILDCEKDSYTATYVAEFDDLLQYSGSSIRISGTKGIRMITSITKSNKQALTGKGLAGYTLVEYGTALAWASDLKDGNPLTLGQAYTKSNYAYKKGVADPVYKDTGKLVQYTNVLVGFNNDQCIPDIAMRPYIIIADSSGRQITIYGGILYRSVGYIAYQNRNAFKAGTTSYEYVWSIIHHVYGNRYDVDYKG